MAVIALEGMRFFAHHGVFAEEKASGNQFEVDVWVDTGNRTLPETDQIGDALDYGQIYEISARIMARSVDLLETLVLQIGREILAEMDGFDHVRVRVSKLNPPVAGPCVRSTVESTFYK
ncbi:MAG TPA: dihydroneopterin aldolase [Bacteroidetes bacterium]|nr:dihydroneopterin aldolase [Bacteroidota bacterium]